MDSLVSFTVRDWKEPRTTTVTLSLLSSSPKMRGWSLLWLLCEDYQTADSRQQTAHQTSPGWWSEWGCDYLTLPSQSLTTWLLASSVLPPHKKERDINLNNLPVWMSRGTIENVGGWVRVERERRENLQYFHGTIIYLKSSSVVSWTSNVFIYHGTWTVKVVVVHSIIGSILLDLNFSIILISLKFLLD